jgi:hypothetical protein
MWFFFLLAMVGLIASGVAHFSTFAGVDPQEVFPAVWLLHIGIFVVMIPAIGVQNSLRTRRGKRDMNDAFADAPAWLRTLSKLLFAYMFVNFAVFIFMMRGGSPHHEENGKYVLSNHGKVSREISAEDFHRYQGYEVRGFSGHWMGFYAMAMTLMASGMACRQSEPQLESRPVPGPGHRRWLLPTWAHIAVSIPVQMIGFFTGPVLVAVLMTYFRGNGIICFLLIPFFVSAFVGVGLARTLYNRHVPARCPACGGRTYCTDIGGFHSKYTCRDCGHVDE